MTQKILLVGSRSQARIMEGFINNCKKNLNIKKFFNNKKTIKNLEVGYIYDPLAKKPTFKTKSKFINNRKKLKLIKKKIDFFLVCIGGAYGKSRYLISLEFSSK